MVNAGLKFSAQPSSIDERLVENNWRKLALSDASAADLALHLAVQKAKSIHGAPDDVIIGCDQITRLNQEILHKPTSIDFAYARIEKLAGKTHHLDTSIALLRHGQVIWSFVDASAITLRTLTPSEITNHCARMGDQLLYCAGGYQIEGPAVTILDKIEGDYFAILGLPLLPLLAALRTLAPELLPD